MRKTITRSDTKVSRKTRRDKKPAAFLLELRAFFALFVSRLFLFRPSMGKNRDFSKPIVESTLPAC